MTLEEANEREQLARQWRMVQSRAEFNHRWALVIAAWTVVNTVMMALNLVVLVVMVSG